MKTRRRKKEERGPQARIRRNTRFTNSFERVYRRRADTNPICRASLCLTVIARKLPKPPEETFTFSKSPKIEAEQRRMMEQTRSIMDERVAWNVTPAEAKKAQRATYNK